jgi:hypothetical protein
MTVDRCDFQVPPAAPGWYGILTETGSRAALWNGADWAEYPRRSYARSMKAFGSKAALVWRSGPRAFGVACRAGFLFADVQ